MAKNIRIDENTSFNPESGEFINSNIPSTPQSTLPNNPIRREPNLVNEAGTYTSPLAPSSNSHSRGGGFNGWWILILFIIVLVVYLIYQSGNKDSSNTVSQTTSTNVINRVGYISADNTANIRSGPSKNYSKVSSNKRGESVYVIEQDRSTGWYKVRYGNNGNVGYISNELISFNVINPKPVQPEQRSESADVTTPNNPSQSSYAAPTVPVKQFKMILCSECDGHGEIHTSGSCRSCSGIGNISCPQCNGNGKYICDKCNGKKKFVCRNCGGATYFVCRSCGGKTYFTCRTCNGSGYSNNRNCFTCRGTGRTPCYTCRQTGKTPCYTCRQTGYTPCLTCRQTGYLTCRKCKNGLVLCNTCQGKGQVSSTVTCTKCKGKGQIQVEI